MNSLLVLLSSNAEKPSDQGQIQFLRALKLLQLSPSLRKLIENYQRQSRCRTLGEASTKKDPEA